MTGNEATNLRHQIDTQRGLSTQLSHIAEMASEGWVVNVLTYDGWITFVSPAEGEQWLVNPYIEPEAAD